MSVFTIGKQYKLVDASKDRDTKFAVDRKLLVFPDDGVFTCHGTVNEGCVSHTEGVTWRGSDPSHSSNSAGWFCASEAALQSGAFEEVING